jgi:hypothetical protein
MNTLEIIVDKIIKTIMFVFACSCNSINKKSQNKNTYIVWLCYICIVKNKQIIW